MSMVRGGRRGANLKHAGRSAVAEALEPRRLLSGGEWSQIAKLLPGDGEAWDNFGVSVAIDGDIAIVGSPYDVDHGGPSGSAYVFDVISGTQVAKLLPTDGEGGREEFGYSVAISGNVAIVGSPNPVGCYEGNCEGPGSAYLFDATTGTQLAKLTPAERVDFDLFGYSVAISGNTALVGSPGRGPGSGPFAAGNAYLFNVTTGQQIARLTAYDGALRDFFGWSVALSDNTAIIGSPLDDDNGSDSGSAYLFNVTTHQQGTKLKPADGAAGDNFGYSVAISGNTAVIGSCYDDDNGSDSGSAYLFDLTANQLIAKLKAADGAVGDRFGWSVALGGNSALIGSQRDDDNGVDSGSAYLFDATTGQPIAKLKADDGAADDRFGSSVALSDNTAFVGSDFDDNSNGTDSGSAYLFSAAAAPPAEILAKGVAYLNWGEGPVTFPGAESYIVEEVFEAANGLYAIGFRSDTYGPALVFRGTQEFADWWENSDPRGVGYDQFTAGWGAMREWLTSLDGVPVDLIGHSLGGALAQWTAAAWTASAEGDEVVVDEVVTFNATGISAAQAAVFNSNQARANKVTHHIADGDIVTLAGEAFINGTVHLASFDELNPYNTHVLPLTVPAIGLLDRPTDLTWSTLSTVSLNALTFTYTDRDYFVWLAGLRAATSLLAVYAPVLTPLRAVPALLSNRANAEVSRAAIGKLLRLVGTQWEFVDVSSDEATIRFVEGNALTLATKLQLDRNISMQYTPGLPPSIEFTGGMELDLGLNLTINLPDWLGGPVTLDTLFDVADLDAAATLNSDELSLQGAVSILDGVVGAANGSVALDMKAGTASLSGNLSLLDGMITTGSTFLVDGDLNLTSGGVGALSFPVSAPWVGGLTISSANYLTQFSNDGVSANDHISTWGTLGPFTLGLRIGFDGTVSTIGANDLPSMPAFGPEAGQTFQVAGGTSSIILMSEWTTAGSATIRMRRPDGSWVNEADFASTNIALYSALNTSRRRAVVVTSPVAGNWSIEVVNPGGLGTVSYAGFGVSPTIGAVVTGVSGGQRREVVSISTSVVDPSNTAKVSLYYDDDGDGLDGVLIASNLTPVSGVVNYAWTPADAPTGPTFIYAIADGPGLIPAADYAAAPITITEVRPEVLLKTFEYELRQQVLIEFSQNVGASLSASDIVLTNLPSGVTIPSGSLTVVYDPNLNRAKVGFGAASLPDGNYRLTIAANAIQNSDGETMATPITTDFFVLSGDANRDRQVNIGDFSALASRFNRPATFSQGDFNYSGTVEIGDFAILASKFNTGLPATLSRGAAEPGRWAARAAARTSASSAGTRFSEEMIEEILAAGASV